jgi:sulfatase modifying factor 1
MPDATYTQTLPDGLSFTLMPVKGDSFQIGSEDGGPFGYEKPPRLIRVKDFYIGTYPVTQALWKAVMGNNPSFFAGDHRPVETVSWDEAKVFIDKLNEKTGRVAPGLVYRLPTEAEWEYAARGGQLSKGYLYAGSDDLKEVGWYDENSHGETKPVGLKDANELDLYDMSGNVWEWVEDHWHDNYAGIPADGSAWTDGEEGSARVLRGGSWSHGSRGCRVAFRFRHWPDSRSGGIGFRLVLALQSDGR